MKVSRQEFFEVQFGTTAVVPIPGIDTARSPFNMLAVVSSVEYRLYKMCELLFYVRLDTYRTVFSF